MLTATAVCRRASSIKVRISINNLGGLDSSDPDLVASSLPFYYVLLSWDIDGRFREMLRRYCVSSTLRATL